MATSPRLLRKRMQALHLLGTMTDMSLATMVKVSLTTIYRWRQKQRVAPYRFHNRQLNAHTKGVQAYRTALQHTSTGLTQSELARQVGVTRQAAYQMLLRLVQRGWVEHTADDPSKYILRE